MKEKWKDIKGYEGYYQISNFGRIKSLLRYKYCYNYKSKKYIKMPINSKILKPRLSKFGYCHIILHKNSKSQLKLIHRLVAEAFIPNPNNYPQVNHKDENKSNNIVNNLEWCDSKYNMNYGNVKIKIAKSLSKKVNQYDLNGNYIKTWECISIPRKLYNASHISECCNGIRKSNKGYIWKYAD